MNIPTPTPGDKFTFGLWTVGWQARDPFGDATRPQLDPVESVHRLSELGAYGVTFHDDDLDPVRRPTPTSARRQIAAVQGRARRDRHEGADGDDEHLHAPRVQGRRVHQQRPRHPPLRHCARSCATWTSPPSSAPTTYVFWGGREGSEVDAGKNIGDALSRYKEGLDLLCQYVIDKGYNLRFAIEPKPNEPRGDILLPTDRSRARVHQRARALRDGRASTPRSATSRCRTSTSCTASRRRCGTRSCSTSTSTASTARSSTRTSCSATATCINAFFLVDLLEALRLRRPAPLRLQADAHRGHRRRLGVGGGQHAHLPRAAREGPGVPRRPARAGGARGLARRAAPPCRRWLPARRTTTSSPTSTRTSTSRPRARAATTTCSSTSSRSSTCSAPPDRGGTRPRRWDRLLDPVVQGRGAGRGARASSCASGRAPHPDGTEVDPRRGGRPAAPRSPTPAGSTTSAAVAVGGQQHGMVAARRGGRVVRPALLWNDTRRRRAATDLVDELGARGLGRRRRARCRSRRSR